MQDHLDMHFRQNRKANQNIGRGHSRSWFVTLEVRIFSTLLIAFADDRHRIGHRTQYRTLRGRVVQMVNALSMRRQLRLLNPLNVMQSYEPFMSLFLPVTKQNKFLVRFVRKPSSLNFSRMRIMRIGSGRTQL